ncbi:MAG: hypothetical protein IJ945_02350 [Oscillospiraceae bacterium]|nr:hypothetical protein [Oscillospiraceae bacterium]
MKNKMLKTLTVILSVFLVVYAGYQAWTLFYNPYKTEIAVDYSVNEAIHVDGIAVRTETVIEDQYDGSVSYIHEDAARVNRNKPVAYAHTSSDTVTKMIKAAELEKEIKLLEEAANGISQLYGSSEFINDQIGNSVMNYSDAIAGGDYEEFLNIKDELLLSINKKTSITGEPNKFDERITLLKAEYDELQNEINADEAKTVASPKTGYFISSVDGFENIITKETLFEKNVSEIEEIINQELVFSEQKIGKIADNFKWYYVISVSPEDAERFTVGRDVTVNFDGINDSQKLEIYEKIEDDTSENIIIVLLSRTFTAELASLRQISADIVFSTISGLRISSDSVRFNENQQMGVFILDRGSVDFRTIDIVYTGSGYNIVKWNQNSKTALQLFDEVLIGGNDLYVGKIID